MRFAVLSEIHGNALALQAALEAIDAWDGRIERIISAGDAVGLGPQPNEVIDLLREWKVEALQGNYEDAVAYERPGSGVDFATANEERADAQAVNWTRSVIRPDNLSYLQSWARDIRLTPNASGMQIERDALDAATAEYKRTFFTRAFFGGMFRQPPKTGKRVLVTHGTTRALNEYVRPNTAASILASVAREAQTDVLVTGHAGTTFERVAGEVQFIGSGSVSGPNAVRGVAEFVVVEVRDTVTAEFGAAAYDAAAFLAVIEGSDMPEAVKVQYRERIG